MMTKEEWRWIPGYEDRYEISDLGRVRSYRGSRGIRLREPQIRTASPDSKGYHVIKLYKNDRRAFRLSRLVLTIFKGDGTGLQASHLDGNVDNNNLSNLTWETPLQNSARQVQHGTRRRGEDRPAAKLTEKQVRKIRQLRNEGITHAILASLFKVSSGNVSDICNRKSWTHVT